MPFTTTWQGNLALDVGDKVILNNDKKIVNSIVTKQKIKFNGGLTYETECSGLSEQQQKTQLTSQKQVNRRFASEIKQNADEILLRVTADGVETLVKQNADSWELSINGKLTGRTYKFDGEGFTLGGTEGDVAKHTPALSEWNFKNGGKARIDENGFYFQHGSSKNEYHSLIKVFTKTVITDLNGYFSEPIQLPTEFSGKNIATSVSIESAYINPNGQGILSAQSIGASVNGTTVTVSGQVILMKLASWEDPSWPGRYFYGFLDSNGSSKAQAKITFKLTVIA